MKCEIKAAWDFYARIALIERVPYMSMCIVKTLETLNACTAENFKFYIVVANDYNCY